MNKISQIAKLLGVELNTPFKIIFYNHKNPFNLFYKITQDGLEHSVTLNGKYYKSNALEGLILGKHKIILIEREY